MTDDETDAQARQRGHRDARTGRRHRALRRFEERAFDNSSPDLDRFGSLLVITIVAVVALSLVDLNSFRETWVRGVFAIVLSLTTGIALVLALRAAGVARRGRRIAEIAVVVAFGTSALLLVIEIASGAATDAWQSTRPSPLWVGIAILTPIAVIHRLVQHRTVSGQTLAGAIAAYLLISVAFCFVFMYVDSVSGDGLFGGATPVASHEFMYFSLVSITTVGYGDLAPSGPIGRLLATSEAVIGQIYLVTFVAMLVGLLIQQRGDQAETDAPEG